MGVAGDGNTKLEKFDMSSMAKSKMMSAKNAFGRTTGYADTLIEKGVDTARAQQLENWHNQQEIINQRKSQRFMTEDFDQVDKEDDNWRNLASFGVERTQVSSRLLINCLSMSYRLLRNAGRLHDEPFYLLLLPNTNRTSILRRHLDLLLPPRTLKEPSNLLAV